MHLFVGLESRARPIEPCAFETFITISLDYEHSPSCHKVLWLELADVNEVEDIVVKPRVDFCRFGLNGQFGIDLELFESGLFPGSILNLRVAFNAHSSMYDSITKLTGAMTSAKLSQSQ